MANSGEYASHSYECLRDTGINCWCGEENESIVDRLQQQTVLSQALKFDNNKLRFDLIPSSVLEELAMVYTIGSYKYADENWRKGLSFKRLFGAMMRHAWAWFRGEKYDPDGQHHLSSVIWCAAALIEHEILKPELDDRFEPQEEKLQSWWITRQVDMARSLQLIKEKYSKNANNLSGVQNR